MDLPEACIAHVLSFTYPRDACRLSCVSSSFRSAADSDAIWDSFLPPDCLSLLSRSSPRPSFSSKKHLYLSLSHQPLLMDGGLKSFWLDKLCGAKCFMLSPRSLSIVWGCTPRYWRRTSVPEGSAYVFEYQPVEVCVGIAGKGSDAHKRLLCLDPKGARRRQQQLAPRHAGLLNRTRFPGVEARAPIPAEDLNLQYPNKRADGWFKIELGNSFNEGIEDKELEMAVCEVKGGNWKSGLIIQGFEIRPKLDE